MSVKSPPPQEKVRVDGQVPGAVGYNYYEQLGDGSAVFQQTAFVPMKATAWDPSWPVTALAAGGWHTVLLAGVPPGLNTNSYPIFFQRKKQPPSDSNELTFTP